MLFRLEISSDPVAYRKFVEYACSKSAYFTLCTFKHWHKKDMTKKYMDAFDFICGNLQKKYDYSLFNHYAKGQKFFAIQLNDQTKQWLRDQTNFFDWKFPNLPEDLSFYTEKEAWFNYISHENMGFLKTKSPQDIRFIDNFFTYIKLNE